MRKHDTLQCHRCWLTAVVFIESRKFRKNIINPCVLSVGSLHKKRIISRKPTNQYLNGIPPRSSPAQVLISTMDPDKFHFLNRRTKPHFQKSGTARERTEERWRRLLALSHLSHVQRQREQSLASEPILEAGRKARAGTQPTLFLVCFSLD